MSSREKMKNRSPMMFVLLLCAASAFAQGVQTAALEGTVTAQDGTPVPGVTVSVTSPALMGERTAVSTGTGDYVLHGLPPGDYRILFALEGMRASDVSKTLALGIATRVDAKMRITSVSDAITVTASSPTVLENTTVGANIKAETVRQLPILRTPTDIASLSPGVTGDRGGRATTPIFSQLSISGGMAYDNNFLINGVNFQDNFFGIANNLFVEDAIQETQVLTSGISAEYGHFTGGVLNLITKSGGNQFTGTVRDSMNKGSWLALTPYEQGFRGDGVTGAKPAPHTAKLSHIYEATLGGPIWKDRLWFFLAGRKEKSNTPGSLALTGVAYNVQQSNKRPEVKLTANLGSSQTLQADFINNPVARNLEVQKNPLTLSALGVNSLKENRGYSAFYSGVLRTNVFAEARYSKKHFRFRGTGGTSTNIVDSPFRSQTRVPGVTVEGTYNAPYFDVTDPEDRNNRQLFAAMSYLLTRPTWGSHDVKVGIERFIDTRIGGGSPSATNYVFYGGYKTRAGLPLFDANQNLIPLFNPLDAAGGASTVTRIEYSVATRGAKLDSTTDSLFINDRWNLNTHFNFNLGARFEKTKSKATGNIVSIDTSNLVPRLGASYDPQGNGKYKVDVTYAQYVGRYNPALAGANTPVGSPSVLSGYYTGPKGEGRDFAPGFNVNNYKFDNAIVPTANIFTSRGLHAPINNEWTVSTGMALPKSGWAKATFIDRRYKDFIEDFITIDQGCTQIVFQGINAGCVDNIVYRNSNGPKRVYQATELQSHYDLARKWGLEGNWTHQLKNHGTYEGESVQTISTSPFGDRPELQNPRELPYGRLAQYEANRVRLWTTYILNLGRFGTMGTALLYRYDSPLTFSYAASTARTKQSAAANPGYQNSPKSVTLFWGDRGAGEFNPTSLFDTSLQWSIPFARVTPWFKFDVRNVFNKDTLISYNTTVVADATSPVDSLGYATGYTKGATFGRPRAATDYALPRQYLLTGGIRF